jgi:uncharacterized protein YyaL (SSP411 family)
MVYQEVALRLSGKSGWPLTIMMTPDRQPFFADTYIPKNTNGERTGLVDQLSTVNELWSNYRTSVIYSANQIAESLKNHTPTPSVNNLGKAEIEMAYQQLQLFFDPNAGGLQGAPKFPLSQNVLFLLRYWKRTGDKQALDMAELTLQSMRRGGIYDQIGFGIHRYSTDSGWVVPHFEKMLYDQALVATAYIEAYQATGKPEYAQTAREILDYVLRDMQAPGGGYYATEYADSEGQEGKYYLWATDDVQAALSPSEADLAIKIYNMKQDGNFGHQINRVSTKNNILYLSQPLTDIALELNRTAKDLESQIETIRRKMLAFRENRVHPDKDDKILTDWNSMMITAFAKAGRALDELAYIQAARETADFILTNLVNTQGKLLHSYRNGKATVDANLDDYAYLVNGLIELYQTTFEVKYLQAGLKLNAELINNFWDNSGGGFYFTGDNSSREIIRIKPIYDGATPS